MKPSRFSILCLFCALGGFPSAGTAEVFDVRQFGAKGDGKAPDTEAIQKALDKCGETGGGTVLLSAGTYLSKPIFLHSQTTLEFWWGPALIAKWTNLVTPGYTLPRPRLVLLTNCKDVRVQDVTLANSPCFHLVPLECENVVISNVTVMAPANSPNTDGIDPSVCKNVRISHCRIDVGDDNIAIKSGRKVAGREFACEDLVVTDCVFLHGHGMSIGSESAGGIKNLTVQRCKFEDTENGIRIKSPRGRGGVIENASYSDITMHNVDSAITITCYYPKIPTTDSAQPVTSGTPAFRNIRISNLTATCPHSAGMIIGLPESPITNVFLQHLRISSGTTGLTIRNAKGVQLQDVQVVSAQGQPVIVQDAQVEGLEQSKNPK